MNPEEEGPDVLRPEATGKKRVEQSDSYPVLL